MTGQRDILSCLSEKKFSQKVTLGDDYQYPIKGVGESNYKLNSGTPMKMKDVLYVPGLTKNLLSISALEKKGFRVAFIDGEVLMWAKGKTMEEAIVIGKEECGLYKLKGHSEAAMAHSIENPCELWHRRLAHINYKTLPYVRKAHHRSTQNSRLTMKVCAMDVHKERTSRTLFRREIVKQKES
jgi:hypothetical protein